MHDCHPPSSKPAEVSGRVSLQKVLQLVQTKPSRGFSRIGVDFPVGTANKESRYRRATDRTVNVDPRTSFRSRFMVAASLGRVLLANLRSESETSSRFLAALLLSFPGVKKRTPRSEDSARLD